MKSLINKFFSHTSRFEFIYLLIPFILWLFCFRQFFSGHLRLEADAISYAYHIGFYTDNLSKGIIPLWDPTWYSGAPYHFFLRRIGEVNPLLLINVFLKWCGFSSAVAYLIYLSIYYFLASWALYLITRFILVDRFYAFTAYVLFLFSSWGCEIFYNYIIIIFVPIIWFFYFLLSFSRNQKKGYFLGICFCLGLIVTTYIPFFFLTILIVFLFFYFFFYGKDFIVFFSKSFLFFQKNKVFTVFCIFFLLASCLPGLVFYKESKNGEFVLPNRHSGADTSSVVAVGLNNVTSGDIISHGYFDRIFDDHANLDLGDIYLPYMFFLILLVTISARSNKLIFFLLFNILALSLITITSAAGVHRFLYEHVIIFKFIRNIYYFFWLAMLPMGILLAVVAFKSLFISINDASRKNSWFIYIIFCHSIFVLFLLIHKGVLWGAWVSVFISLIYFVIYFYFESKISYFAGFLLILLAVFTQSIQVYSFLDRKLFLEQHQNYIDSQNKSVGIQPKLDLYYASNWFAFIVNYIDPQVLENYRNHQFVLYDNVIPYGDNTQVLKPLQLSMAGKINVAFISKFESDSNDWRSNPNAAPQADFDPVKSGKISILYSDANTWILKTNFSVSQFLVINDSYNSAWHAYINGHQVHLFRSNVAFKGLWIPTGESQIKIRFSNPIRYLFHISLIIFFAGTFLYLLILLTKNRYQKNNE